jgi:hypothetical protein
MVAPEAVRDKDLQTLLGIVSGRRDDPPPGGLPWSLLQDLMGLIRCDEMTLAGFDTPQQETWFAQTIPPGHEDEDEDDVEVFWANYPDSYCCYPVLTA